VQSAHGVRIAQENGVVEVEDEAARGAAQEVQLPRRRQTALEDDNVGVAERATDAETVPPAFRPGKQFQAMPGGLQGGPEGSDAIAATDVFGVLNQGGQMHRRSSVTPCMGAGKMT
jgi:hypothetical protein